MILIKILLYTINNEIKLFCFKNIIKNEYNNYFNIIGNTYLEYKFR